MKQLKFCAVLMCLFVASQSVAQDSTGIYNLSLEELLDLKVTTASRYTQEAHNAPAIISVITAEQIRTFGATRLIDVLQRLPGVLPLFSEVYHFDKLMVRGETGNVNHVLTLINGQPFQSPVEGSTSNVNYFNAFPIEAIARIEFIRGPGSVLYGSNAYSGVINIITHGEEKHKNSVGVSAAKNNTRNGDVQLTEHWTEGYWHLAASARDSDGWPAEFATEGIAGTERASLDYADESRSLFSRIKHQHLQIEFYHADSTVRGYRLGATDNDYRQSHLTLKHSYTVNPQLQTETNLALHDEYITIDDTKVDALSTRAEYVVRWQPSGPHHWISGLVTERLSFDIDDAFGTVIGIPERQYGFKTGRYNAFAQWEYALNEDSQITLGGQYNKADGEALDFVPRFAYVQKLSIKHVFKFLYSEAYRSPSLLENGLDSAFLIGNEGLDPETVKTLDIQLAQSSTLFHWSATAFYSKQKDLIRSSSIGITPDPGTGGFQIDPGQYINQGELDFYGWEFETIWKPNDHWTLEGSGSWQRNEDDNRAEDTTYAPRWMAKLGIAYEAKPGLSIAAYNVHVDEFKDAAKMNAYIDALNAVPEAYDLLSFNIILSFQALLDNSALDGFIMNFCVDNALDEDISQTQRGINSLNALPAYSGRSTKVALRYHW